MALITCVSFAHGACLCCLGICSSF